MSSHYFRFHNISLSALPIRHRTIRRDTQYLCCNTPPHWQTAEMLKNRKEINRNRMRIFSPPIEEHYVTSDIDRVNSSESVQCHDPLRKAIRN